MGTFFAGEMVGGNITQKRLPVLSGSVKIGREGYAEIEVVLKPYSASNSALDSSIPLDLQLMNHYLGYVGDDGTTQSLLAMGPITSIEWDDTDFRVRVRAGGISAYLDRRWFEDGTIALNTSTSFAGNSLKDLDFNPSARTYGSWISHTLSQLTSRSSWTQTFPAMARNAVVPINYLSNPNIPTSDPFTDTFAAPYNGADFTTVAMRLDDIYATAASLAFFGTSDVLTWSVRPSFVGQTSTSVTDLDWDATAVQWHLFLGNYQYTNRPTKLYAYWSRDGYGGFFPEPRLGPQSNVSRLSRRLDSSSYNTMIHASKPDVAGDIDAYGPQITTQGATDGFTAIVEARRDKGVAGYETALAMGFYQSRYTVWEFDLPMQGQIRPGWDLPGQTIILDVHSHPTLGVLSNLSLRVNTVEFKDGASKFTVTCTPV